MSFNDDRELFSNDDERSRLLPPGNSSLTNTSASVGVPSTIIEPPNVYKSRWRSIRVMYLTMFLSSVSFSICMSSIWQYLEVNDKNASTDFLGWVVAAYSLGQLVASPIFGAWANCRKKSGEPLLVSLSVNILANILYAYVESIPVGRKYFLMTARLLIGFGAGNVAVVRSYVSGATTIKERTGAMANTSIFQAVGFIIGPGIQAALVPIGFPGPVHIKELHFDFYTLPGFLSALVGLINVLLLLCVFSEHRVYDDNVTLKSVLSSTGINSHVGDNLNPDYFAVVSVVVIFFVVLFIFSVFETIATPLTMHMYGWKRSTATLYIGILLGLLGILSIGVFIGVKFLAKRLNERYILLLGFCLCFCGYLIYLPWGDNYPDLTLSDLQKNNTENTTEILASIIDSEVLSLRTDKIFYNKSSKYISSQINKLNVNGSTEEGIIITTTNAALFTPGIDNSTIEPRGCPVRFRWCFYTPVITIYQFLIGTVLFAVGYPTCNVITYTLFSKILGPKPQGVWMGWLTASGSLARTVGPVFVSQVYDAFGPRVTFISMCGIVLFTIICVILIFRRLVPFKF